MRTKIRYQYPDKFKDLIFELTSHFSDKVDSLLRQYNLTKRAHTAVLIASWIYLLNLKSRNFALSILPFGKASQSTISYLLGKIRKIADISEEWRLIKRDVWLYWAELVESRVTDDQSIVAPIRGYATRLSKKDFEDYLNQSHSQAALVMVLAFLKARKIGKDRSVEVLSIEVAGIPIHLLFMAPRPPVRNTLLQRMRRNLEEEMYINAAVHREARDKTEIHTADGVNIPARSSDRDAYVVVDGRGKRTYGYQAVIISSSDMFPEAVDVAESKVKNAIIKKNKESWKKAL